jgi:hypothetical protein
LRGRWLWLKGVSVGRVVKAWAAFKPNGKFLAVGRTQAETEDIVVRTCFIEDMIVFDVIRVEIRELPRKKREKP